MELKNFTVALPVGTTDHGDPHLLCPPASWEQIALFFFTNYIAHAATVKFAPAASLPAMIVVTAGALFMPATGLVYGLKAISQKLRSIGRSELQKATIAGALCMYVRSSNWPPSEHTIEVAGYMETLPLGKDHVGTTFASRLMSRRRLYKTLASGYKKVLVRFEILTIVTKALRSRPSVLLDLLKDTATDNESHVLDNTTASVQCCTIQHEPTNKLQGDDALPTICTRTDSLDNFGKPRSGGFALRERSRGPVLPSVPPELEIHGTSHRVTGYRLVLVPENAMVDPMETKATRGLPKSWETRNFISQSSNLAKSLIALVQLCASIFVLTRARGNQIQLYGYAAFSLTVAPYAVMAVVNLLANAFTPSYPCLYLIRNDIMIEMEQNLGLKFDGIVGTLRQPLRDEQRKYVVSKDKNNETSLTIPNDNSCTSTLRLLNWNDVAARGYLPRRTFCLRSCGHFSSIVEPRKSMIDLCILLIGLILVVMPVVIIELLSGFRIGSATSSTQRGVLMTWLVVGQVIGLCAAAFAIQPHLHSAQKSVLEAPPSMPIALTETLSKKLDIHDVWKDQSSADLRSKWLLSSWFLILGERFHLRTKLDIYLFMSSWDQNSMVPSYSFVRRLFSRFLEDDSFDDNDHSFAVPPWFMMATIVVGYAAPAVWGFIIVGQMLVAYGNCIRIY